MRRRGGDGAVKGGGGSKGGGGGGKSFFGKGGLEGEVSRNLLDVVCTWTMLIGMVASSFWTEWAVPKFCASANASEKVCGQFRSCCFCCCFCCCCCCCSCCCCPSAFRPALDLAEGGGDDGGRRRSTRVRGRTYAPRAAECGSLSCSSWCADFDVQLCRTSGLFVHLLLHRVVRSLAAAQHYQPVGVHLHQRTGAQAHCQIWPSGRSCCHLCNGAG